MTVRMFSIISRSFTESRITRAYHRSNDRLEIDPWYIFVARHLEKILIVYGFFFLFLAYANLAFVRFHDFFLLTDPLILLLISTRDREK